MLLSTTKSLLTCDPSSVPNANTVGATGSGMISPLSMTSAVGCAGVVGVATSRSLELGDVPVVDFSFSTPETFAKNTCRNPYLQLES